MRLQGSQAAKETTSGREHTSQPAEKTVTSANQQQTGQRSPAPLFYPAGPGQLVYQESDFEPWTDDCVLSREDYDEYKACLVGHPAPVRPNTPAFSDEALQAAGFASWCAYNASVNMLNW
jgi:hypothetical protein